MAHLPGSISTSTLADRLIHIDETNYVPGPAAQLISTAVDSGATPTTTIRKGNCIVKKTSTGLYYIDDGVTNAGSADRNTQAVVTASESADTDWDGNTITVSINGQVASVVVTLAGSDDTDAEVAAALNANAIFAANCVASVAGSRVVIKTLATGADIHLHVTSSLATAFGAAGTSDSGTDADYFITEEEVSTLDPNTGSAATVEVKTSFKAFYDESELLNLSSEARAVLARRGARFG